MTDNNILIELTGAKCLEHCLVGSKSYISCTIITVIAIITAATMNTSVVPLPSVWPVLNAL